MKITFYAHTAQGKRQEQQDSFLMLGDSALGLQIAAVADGMGGHPRGADASREVINPFRKILRPDAFRSEQEAVAEMRRVMRVADDAVTRLGLMGTADNNHRLGPGSTLTAVAAHPDAPFQVILGHIGDSRAYLLRSGSIKQLTRDHTQGYGIDRALGNWSTDRSQSSLWHFDGNGKPTPYDVEVVKVQTGDTILLCTDGIHGVLSDEQILTATHIPFSLGFEALPAAVVRDALNAGSTDNCTVVVGVVS